MPTHLFYPKDPTEKSKGELISASVECPKCHKPVEVVDNHKVVNGGNCRFCGFPFKHPTLETSQL